MFSFYSIVFLKMSFSTLNFMNMKAKFHRSFIEIVQTQWSNPDSLKDHVTILMSTYKICRKYEKGQQGPDVQIVIL